MGKKNDQEYGTRQRKRDKAKNRPPYTSKHVRQVTENIEQQIQRNNINNHK